MNQILSVDPNNKNTNKSSIHSILLVFSIILMLFGMCIASTGAYSYYKNISNTSSNSLEVSNNTKPVISIEIEDSSNIKIAVNHDKELASVTYSINGEDPIKIETNNKTEVYESVSLPVGDSSIKIIAEDINGMTASREDSYNVEQELKISLKKVDGGVQVTTESGINIDYIKFYWDEDNENAQSKTINDTKDVTYISAKEGTHTLNIIAVDIEGNEEKKSQEITGDIKPKLSVKTNGKVFQITASDDEELSKIEITLNSNETITKEINKKEYTTTIDLEDGINKLIVTVYDKRGVSETSKVKYTKE